jgi:glycosyltransferase 2 family protein
MRPVSILAASIGLALTGALVAHFGMDAVARALLAVGWAGFAAICSIHLALIAVAGLAWWVLLPGTSPWASVWGRLVRDAGCEVLPLSQVGGFVLGARAITFAGLSGILATASTIIDVTLEFLSQLAYTALALSGLLYLQPDTPAGFPVAIGLAAACLLAAGLLVAQRQGFDLFNRLAGALGRGWAERSAAGAAALHAAISGIYRRHGRLCANFAIHLASWVVSPVQAWLALRLAGAPLGFGAVLVIESLPAAARSAAFAVPNAVGVQEGLICPHAYSFGHSAENPANQGWIRRVGGRACPTDKRCNRETGRQQHQSSSFTSGLSTKIIRWPTTASPKPCIGSSSRCLRCSSPSPGRCRTSPTGRCPRVWCACTCRSG